jgi:hypothetical protein
VDGGRLHDEDDRDAGARRAARAGRLGRRDLLKTDYVLMLRITTRDGDPPPEIVLRAALKTLLRRHGVRVVAAAPGVAQDATKPTPPAAGPVDDVTP